MRVNKFKIGSKVRINENAKNGLPNDVGKIGLIYSCNNGVLYDYIVWLADGSYVKVKESELDRVDE